MKQKLFWAEEAVLRLNEIEDFISKDSTEKAIKFVDRLIAKAESISENAERGRVVPELAIENIRELLFKNYRIVYLIKKRSIEILTVFESHKLLTTKEVIKQIK